jgi:hypothetical protein
MNQNPNMEFYSADSVAFTTSDIRQTAAEDFSLSNEPTVFSFMAKRGWNHHVARRYLTKELNKEICIL